MSRKKVSLGVTVALFASLMLPVLAAVPAAAAAPQNINDKLEGCKPTVGSYQTVPNVICTNNANYTTGNLGKSWNELDLVPYRYTAIAGNNAPATQTYTGAIALDAIDVGRPGYDVLSAFTKNTALSTGGAGNCAVTSGPQSNKTPGFGGTDTTIYRLITITQAAGTTCVFDGFGRLAVGAHLYPGSSLHANVANEALTQAGSDVSIPVKEISPQSLQKTVAAVQDSDFAWTINKSPNPAELIFGNVCDTENFDTTLQTDVTITWTKIAGEEQAIKVHTLIEATNPAARVITVNVSDQLYSGAGTSNPIGPATVSGPIDVPANTTNFDIMEFDTVVPAGTEDLHDVATATYTDKLTGVPVPGQATAGFPAFVDDDNDPQTPPVDPGTFYEVGDGDVTNDTATITDVETLSGGAGASFTVDSVTGDADALLGASLSGTNPVTWTSGTVSGGGSVTLHKTVTLDPSVGATSVELDDTATINGSDGFTTSTTGHVDIDSTLSGSLVINKETSVPVGPGDVVFEFEVNPGAIPVTVTIPEGGTEGSSDALTGLAGGTYTVSETNSNAFPPAGDQDFTIGKGEGEFCAAELEFLNTAGPATATATKITFPAGFEAGWEFTVTLDGNPFDTGTSDIAGNVQWDTAGSDTLTLADEGTYTITETTQTGWVLDPITVNDNGNGTGSTDATSCSFTVDLPADSDGVFGCSFTNTDLGSITLAKETVPSPDPTDTTFTFTRDFGSGTVDLKDGESDLVSDLAAGNYSASETVPGGWDLLTFTCSDNSDPAAIDLGVGEDVTCTARNTQQTGTITVVKVTDPSPDTSDTSFPFTSDFMGDFSLKNGDGGKTSDPLTVNGGPYSVAEVLPVAGWDPVSFTCDNGDEPSAITLTANANVVCTATNRARGSIDLTKTFDGGPIPAGESFIFNLRTGASQGNPGIVVDPPGNVILDSTDDNFVWTNLVPGDYQLCELEVPAGGHSSLSDLPGAFVPDLLDNSTQCAPFTVDTGETEIIVVDNTPPPGGDQRTIGYWKNHASCKTSGGNQEPVLDQTLALFPIVAPNTTHGFYAGKLYVDTCIEARQLLDKRPVSGTNKKTASDPAFNLAAQYVAAKLNVMAGADACGAAVAAINAAQALLDLVNFNGIASPTMTATQRAQANSLASTLDAYNNGNLCT